MKAVFPAGSGRVELREVPVPEVGTGEILVKMRACGICGTDLEKTRGETHTPRVLGHEVSGIISQVGDGVSNLSRGDRVVVHHHVSCGECYYCKSGSPTLCDLFLKTNLDPCGFAEYFRVPEENVSRSGVIEITESLSFEEASFVEPLGCCLRSLSRVGDVAGRSAAVLGVGSTGLLMFQLLKSRGAGPLVASDLSDARLRFCRKMGVDVAVNPATEDLAEEVRRVTDGRGVDLVVVATESVKAVQQALSIVRRGGTVNLFGMPTRDAKLVIDPSQVFIREVTVIPSYSTSETEMLRAIELLTTHQVSVRELISHRFSLGEAVEAFDVAADVEKSVKVIVSN